MTRRGKIFKKLKPCNGTSRRSAQTPAGPRDRHDVSKQAPEAPRPPPPTRPGPGSPRLGASDATAAEPRREDGRRSRDICGQGPVAGWTRRGVASDYPGGENAPGEPLVCAARRSRIPDSEKEPGRESCRAGPGSRKTAWRRLRAPAGLLSWTRGELASRADPPCRGPRPGTGGSATSSPTGHLPWVPLNPGGSSLTWRSVRSGTRETPNPACLTSSPLAPREDRLGLPKRRALPGLRCVLNGGPL
ncbi:proline-rich protein HaeIII subfamily 1 [Hylobates moloch]|uniref:proline-rich protein HaeIII subfamily 1 n=1 Tax=Hylobates moloch TaxID=81572 RepID=UPI0026747D9A|nr:proline-rich protein HaeIII subfamily 1 [Hylobates moloch]